MALLPITPDPPETVLAHHVRVAAEDRARWSVSTRTKIQLRIPALTTTLQMPVSFP